MSEITKKLLSLGLILTVAVSVVIAGSDYARGAIDRASFHIEVAVLCFLMYWEGKESAKPSTPPSERARGINEDHAT